MHTHVYTYTCTYTHTHTYIYFLKKFLKQLHRINDVCRIMVLVAVICCSLIDILFMNNLVYFLPAKLMPHHVLPISYLGHTYSGNTLKVL